MGSGAGAVYPAKALAYQGSSVAAGSLQIVTEETSRPADPAADPAAAPRAGPTLAELRAAAIAAHHRGETEAARTKYRLYLAHRPGDAAIWTNLGALHRKSKDYEAAVACQRRAVELAPGASDYLNNLGNALYDNADLDGALAVREEVARLRPGDAEALQYVATALRGLNRHADAVAMCDRALALDPDHNEAKIQKAMALLALGDYPAGFDLFEARWQGDEVSKPEFAEPEWQGEDPAGKTILVMPEQGFGDTVLMARLMPLLAARGARVLLVTKPPLMRLFSRLEGVAALLPIGAKKPPIDFWVSMMSLPRHLGLTLDALPPPARLHIPDDARARAERILGPHRDRLKIGVLWSGSVTYRANHKRSFPAERFYALAGIPGVSLFSLYKGPLHEAFVESGLASVVVDACGTERDFADTAALIDGLDLVVSMDSAAVHVAASLGAKVWNLLHFSAYWLYGPFRETTPWYPSMRLIRQPVPDDWDSVFATVEADIRKLARERR